MKRNRREKEETKKKNSYLFLNFCLFFFVFRNFFYDNFLNKREYYLIISIPYPYSSSLSLFSLSSSSFISSWSSLLSFHVDIISSSLSLIYHYYLFANVTAIHFYAYQSSRFFNFVFSVPFKPNKLPAYLTYLSAHAYFPDIFSLIIHLL